jgi:hypothetical protein
MVNEVYSREKLRQALEKLATHSGTLQERVIEASRFMGLASGETLPEGLREKYQSLWNLLTANDTSHAAEVVPTLDEITLKDVAIRIVNVGLLAFCLEY